MTGWQNVYGGDVPLHSQASLCANYPNDTQHRHAGSHHHHLRDGFQVVVVMKVRSKATHRYTHAVHLRIYAEQGGTWGDQVLKGRYEEGEGAYARGAAGVTVGCQGIAARHCA